ncbi:hypothetical protein QBC32DRAFT_222187 [Pseudoneurospora amorphoporcata]|uniref:Uncharacterized protein n=1 Tax=Pseudoneurospora amorphoporcata TaxID=241081 RepID=A0AAN6NQI4_9PEZI|nr:hypothetical protein QBC32DRAFT_222187 [Pseudoneurospora amorphoporcata]
MESHSPPHMWSVPSSITDPTRVITYYPHDTAWHHVEHLETLMAQCRHRLLSDDGDEQTLQQRLEDYQYAHRHENEVRGGCWRHVPDETWSLANAKITNCQLIQIRDTSDVTGWLEKQFTLHARDAGTFTVLTNVPDRRSQRKQKLRACSLRPPLHSSLPAAADIPIRVPVGGTRIHLCRQPLFLLLSQQGPRESTARASRPLPSVRCFEIFNNIRKPREPQICVLCEDEKEWRLPGQEPEAADPQSQDSDVEEGEEVEEVEEVGHDPPVPIHEDKLVAMLYYETREKKKS